MKVVLFCGGFGMRLREYSQSIPKPLVEIGDRPILWHVMKYYAHYGHTDFVLCLGWQAKAFKRYFLEYDECVSNDFTLSFGPERRGLTGRPADDARADADSCVNGAAPAAAGGGRRHSRRVQLTARDLQDWNITFVDTGMAASVGERLHAVRPHLEGEETFLANYADGLSDVHLPSLIDFHRTRRDVATFAAVKPSHTFHTVEMADDGRVNALTGVAETDTWINAGFFVMNEAIFDELEPGEDLIPGPLTRLAGDGRLSAMRHRGFFGCMDTFKEKQLLDDLYARGDAPWEVWRHPAPQPAAPQSAKTPATDARAAADAPAAARSGAASKTAAASEPAADAVKPHIFAA